MNKNSKFQSGHGVFTCNTCGRKTRGDSESVSCGLCTQCYELGGQDNHHNDNNVAPTPADMEYYNGLVTEIEAKGGNGQKVRAACEYIWTQQQPQDLLTPVQLSCLKGIVKEALTKRGYHAPFTLAEEVTKNNGRQLVLQSEAFQTTPVIFEELTVRDFGGSVRLKEEKEINRELVNVYLPVSVAWKHFNGGTNSCALFTLWAKFEPQGYSGVISGSVVIN